MAKQSHLTHLFFLSLPLSPFLITEKARKCVGKKKKVERELEKEREREVLESGRWRKKRERKGIYGYTCVVEKNQEKKKKKRNV